MKAVLLSISFVLAFLLLVGGFVFAIQGTDFFLYSYFAPKQEAVRREVFEQSKAYNQGMVQELQNMEFEYLRADAEHKTALGQIILHRAADYDVDRMPPDLRQFIFTLKGDFK